MKKFFKDQISIVLTKLQVVFGLPSPSLILAYHSISLFQDIVDIIPKDFHKQIKYLSQHFKLSPLDQLLKISKSQKPLYPMAAITFDDGYLSVIKTAAPILNRFGITGTVFVTGQPSKVNREELENNQKLLTTSHLKQLLHNGWNIGSHTLTHSNLSKVSDDLMAREIVESKKLLERKLQKRIRYFAYPKGYFSDKVVMFVKKARYTEAFSVEPSAIKSGLNPYKIPRLSIDSSCSLAQFKFLTTPWGIQLLSLKKMVIKLINSK